ncbi:MAG: ATP-binding protein [Ignavibacteriae bacterium]|nr:ATP-binding protein [Ignavibacteriota bacterium]MCB9215492.1 ATP-binding protein [Ignavibacteria bacterium]
MVLKTHTLQDFLAGGSVGMIGRNELELPITDFWTKTLRGDHLRILLFEGEAGIGKTTVVRHIDLLNQIIGNLGQFAYIYIRFVPDATHSILPLLIEGMKQSRSVLRLLTTTPEETFASVCGVLRRIIRLRPTIVVVDDLHEMVGESIAEFGKLLDALADEPVGILCTARPVDFPARGVIQRFPFEIEKISGLDREKVSTFFEVFHVTFSEVELDQLVASTLGNPLAIASAFRAAFRLGGIREDEEGKLRTTKAFAEIVKENTKSLVGGMIAHQSPEVRKAALRLSLLGEYFSKESALLIAAGDQDIIDQLSTEGIISRTDQKISLLPGSPESLHLQLHFTHSLVHRELLEEVEELPIEDLCTIIVSAPIATTTPWQAMLRHREQLTVEVQTLPSALLRQTVVASLNFAKALSSTTDWNLGIDILRVVAILLEAESLKGEDDVAILKGRYALAGLNTFYRDTYTPEAESFLRESEAVTRNPSTLIEAALRIEYLRNNYNYVKPADIHDPELGKEIESEVNQLRESFPNLRFHPNYIEWLGTLCHWSQNLPDTYRRRVEKEYESLAAEEALPDTLRTKLQATVVPKLLTLIGSGEELALRTEQYEALKVNPHARRFLASPANIVFLRDSGQIDQLVEATDLLADDSRLHGSWNWVWLSEQIRLFGRLLLGLERAEGEEILARYVERIAEADNRVTSARMVATEIVYAAILRGEREWGAHLAKSYEIGPGGLDEGIRLFLERGELSEEDERELAEGVENEILNIWHIIDRRILFDAVQVRTKQHSDGYTTLIQNNLPSTISWLLQRRLDFLATIFLKDFGEQLSANIYNSLNTQIEEIRARRREQTKSDDKGEVVEISLFGSIEVRLPNRTPIKLRGSRQKGLLAAMAAAELIGSRMDRETFFEVVGIDSENLKNRRDSLNSAIYRLRDLLGENAIISGEEIPRLNLDSVRIDLLENYRHIRLIEEKLIQTNPGQALRLLHDVLDGVTYHILFHSLYHPIFEELREEYENRMRGVVINLAKKLIEVQDFDGAARLTVKALLFVREDKELFQLQIEAQRSSGKPWISGIPFDEWTREHQRLQRSRLT